jgi:copper chaperone
MCESIVEVRMNTVALKIGGMSCGHCVKAVRGALTAVAGVELERVEVGSARVRFDPARTDADRIRMAVEMAGYPVEVPEARP